MTLKEWSEKTNIPIQTVQGGIFQGDTFVVVDHLYEPRRELWNLTDYAVSSVSSIVVWLVPKALE